MEPVALLSVSLSIANKLMDKIPNYDQKKRKEFYELNMRYVEEKKRVYPDRDDDLIMNLRDQLTAFLEAFDKEIG